VIVLEALIRLLIPIMYSSVIQAKFWCGVVVFTMYVVPDHLSSQIQLPTAHMHSYTR